MQARKRENAPMKMEHILGSANCLVKERRRKKGRKPGRGIVMEGEELGAPRRALRAAGGEKELHFLSGFLG